MFEEIKKCENEIDSAYAMILNVSTDAAIRNYLIRKEAELNDILIKLQQNIGQDGWPKQVLYRNDWKLYKFQLNNNKQTVTIVSSGSKGF